MVVAGQDMLTHSDLAFAACERALHPKGLEVLHGDHFVVYGKEGERVLALMTAFFHEHLGAAA